MPDRNRNWGGRALLDLTSYGRRGPGQRIQLSKAEIEVIQRTVSRTPEVMVKVLSKGGQNFKAVQRHLQYLSRNGDLGMMTDDGQNLLGAGIETDLLNDWDLDLDEHRRQLTLGSTNSRTPPKLVHKLLFSMPPGTPPDKILAATQAFAREQFGLKHRYAMVLHTDEPHPHVHMVVKALRDDGVRLNIKKATLREWRSEFARHLREQGVAANATERAVRGETRTSKTDGIYRAWERGVSTHLRHRVDAAASDLLKGKVQPGAGKPQLVNTRREVLHGWQSVYELLKNEGQTKRADQIKVFMTQMKPPHTEQEQIAKELIRLEGDRSTRIR